MLAFHTVAFQDSWAREESIWYSMSPEQVATTKSHMLLYWIWCWMWMPSIPVGSDWIPELRSETSRFFFPSFSSLYSFWGLVGIKPCRFLKGILCSGGHHPILACLGSSWATCVRKDWCTLLVGWPWHWNEQSWMCEYVRTQIVQIIHTFGALPASSLRATSRVGTKADWGFFLCRCDIVPFQIWAQLPSSCSNFLVELYWKWKGRLRRPLGALP